MSKYTKFYDQQILMELRLQLNQGFLRCGRGAHIARTIFLAGHAALPQGMAARSTYSHLALVVNIDPKYSVITQASCTLVTAQAEQHIREILVGRSLKEGIDGIIEEFKVTYRGAALNAIIAALKDLYRTYQAWCVEQVN